MSRQSEAKEKQGYMPKAIPQICSNCKHYKSETAEKSGFYGPWIKETNIRCGIGGFAVKKQGTCKEWKGQP